MEWDSVLLWLVGMSCGMIAFTAARARPVLRGYVVASLLIAGLTALIYWLKPGYAGEVGGVLWGLFLLAPSLLQRWTLRYTTRQQFDRAHRIMTLTRWLHPADGVPQMARLLRALHRAEVDGPNEASTAELDALIAKSPARIARSARLQRARLTRDWAAGLDWVATNVPPAQLRKDPGLLALTVRGLGETGRLGEMLMAAVSANLPAHPVLAPARALVRLSALAFAGQRHAVEELLAGPLVDLPSAVKQFWIGTAEQAAGDVRRRPKTARGRGGRSRHLGRHADRDPAPPREPAGSRVRSAHRIRPGRRSTAAARCRS